MLLPRSETKYSLKKDPQLVVNIVNIIGDWARFRDSLFDSPTGFQEDAGDLWDLGENMFGNTPDHLPSKWRTETIPKELGLGDIPTSNVYRSFVELIQGAMLTSVPGLEFYVEEKHSTETEESEEMEIAEAYEAGDMGQVDATMERSDAREANKTICDILNKEWPRLSDRSRILQELDLDIEHNCNFGYGCLALISNDNELYLRTTHPKLVVCDPYAERSSDIKVVAKVTTRPAVSGRYRDVMAHDMLTWPDSLLPHPENTEVVLEVWIKKGVEFAERKWPAHGMYLKIVGETLEEEAPIHSSHLPVIISSLIPSDRIYGHALSAYLWQPQVRIDKTLAVLQARTARAAGEKYHSSGPTMGKGARATGISAVSNIDDLRKPGVQVIFSENDLKPLPTDHVPTDLMEAYKLAIADMERIAGLSQPFQGIAPKGITAGIAIQTLATMSSRRVSRMAIHLAEALKDVGYMWAEYYLESIGIDVPKGLELSVHVSAVEETSKSTAWAAVTQLLSAGLQVEPAVLLDMVPGLTPPVRDELRKSIMSRPAPTAGQPVEEGQPLPPGASPGGEQGVDVSGALPTDASDFLGSVDVPQNRAIDEGVM